MKYVVVTLLLVAASVFECKKSTTVTPMVKYPKDTEFWVTDFFVDGCMTFLNKCPKGYKYQRVCAKDFNGSYKTFDNYCEMQYENCNTWRNWQIFKRSAC